MVVGTELEATYTEVVVIEEVVMDVVAMVKVDMTVFLEVMGEEDTAALGFTESIMVKYNTDPNLG